MTVLYINACTRKTSRTKALADYLIQNLKEKVDELDLAKIALKPLDEQSLAVRDSLITARDFSSPLFDYAKKFAAADKIVIAAPYWDLSFPAALKTFVEHINIVKLLFDYSKDGKIVPLCKAKKLYYVTTKGGFYSDDFGFGYVKALGETLYGITDIRLIKAEGLDIHGTDVDAVLAQAKCEIDAMLKESC